MRISQLGEISGQQKSEREAQRERTNWCPLGASGIQRSIYDDHPPILSVTDTHVPVSVTVRDTSQVTAEDVRLRRLAPRFRMLSTGVRARPGRTGWRQVHPLRG